MRSLLSDTTSAIDPVAYERSLPCSFMNSIHANVVLGGTSPSLRGFSAM